MAASKKTAPKIKSAKATNRTAQTRQTSRLTVTRKPASGAKTSVFEARAMLLGAVFFVLSLVFCGMAFWRYHI